MKNEALLIAVVGVAVGIFGAFFILGRSEARQYVEAQQEARAFSARCGIQFTGCANEECGGLLNGKPVRFFASDVGLRAEDCGAGVSRKRSSGMIRHLGISATFAGVKMRSRLEASTR